MFTEICALRPVTHMDTAESSKCDLFQPSLSFRLCALLHTREPFLFLSLNSVLHGQLQSSSNILFIIFHLAVYPVVLLPRHPFCSDHYYLSLHISSFYVTSLRQGHAIILLLQ